MFGLFNSKNSKSLIHADVIRAQLNASKQEQVTKNQQNVIDKLYDAIDSAKECNKNQINFLFWMSDDELRGWTKNKLISYGYSAVEAKVNWGGAFHGYDYLKVTW